MNESFVREVLSYLPVSVDPKEKTIFESALRKALEDKKVLFDPETKKELDNDSAVDAFLSAKRIEGCSERTIRYYRITLDTMLQSIGKEYQRICTNDLRSFLDRYQEKHGAGKTTIDNVRRITSSFFSWLENEDYIVKSPVRRIKKVKIGKRVKETYSDETIELLRENAGNLRDLCIIDFLYSTGVRVGELVQLNRSDIDFERRECIVNGKGNKQRKVYFDAKTKVHIEKYLEKRNDDCPALFCSLLAPHKRLEISGVEIALRNIGKRAGIGKVHPHKFRRTVATKAIDKGMPIEQVQRMLGHSQIDTTLEYAMVDDTNVKISHRKYLE